MLNIINYVIKYSSHKKKHRDYTQKKKNIHILHL